MHLVPVGDKKKPVLAVTSLLRKPTNMRLLLLLAVFVTLLALSVGNPVPQRRPVALVGRPGGRPVGVVGRPGGGPGALVARPGRRPVAVRPVGRPGGRPNNNGK